MRRRDEAKKWAQTAFVLLVALQKLGRTAARLLFKAGQLAREDLRGESPDEQALDDEAWADLRAQFVDLIELFPDAGEWFFGVDALDELLREVFDADVQHRLVPAVEAIAKMVDAHVSALLARVIEWGVEDRSARLMIERSEVEKLEAYVRGLENLLQSLLDRLVFSRLFDAADDDDSAQ